MSLVIIGSVAIDSIVTPFKEVDNILGGSATYASISASFFEPSVHIVAVVGRDFDKKYINILKDKKIGLDGLCVKGGKTFRWKGRYSFDLNQRDTVYTHLNVFKEFNPVIPEGLKAAKYVFLANIHPNLQEKVLSQMKRPVFSACDTMDHWIQNEKKSLVKLFNRVDLVFLNESEARLLSGHSNLFQAAKYVLSKGAKMVVIKKGEHGALFFSRSIRFASPAYLLEVVNDPTGAGDAFAGGMLGYIAGSRRINEKNFRRAMAYGNVMASFAVEDFGPRRLLNATRNDIKKRFDDFVFITRL